MVAEPFWEFVKARHDIFIRRVLKREPPPWTTDTVLQRGRFTNVYRELDRGTRYLIVRILSHADDAYIHPHDILFNVLRYRLFNHIPTFEMMGGFQPVSLYDRERVRTVLTKSYSQGNQIFTNAYMTYPGRNIRGRGSKVKYYLDIVDRVADRAVWFSNRLRTAQSLEKACYILSEIPCVGLFIAYEIATDLCYNAAFLTFTENTWVNPGPGAMRGIKELYIPMVRPDFGRTVIRELQRHQPTLNGPPLTLRNVEHSLCEYDKYCRLKRGKRLKRVYNAVNANEDYSLWNNLDRRFYEAANVD